MQEPTYFPNNLFSRPLKVCFYTMTESNHLLWEFCHNKCGVWSLGLAQSALHCNSELCRVTPYLLQTWNYRKKITYKEETRFFLFKSPQYTWTSVAASHMRQPVSSKTWHLKAALTQAKIISLFFFLFPAVPRHLNAGKSSTKSVCQEALQINEVVIQDLSQPQWLA